MKKILLFPVALLAAALAFAQPRESPKSEPRRLELLFLGAPTANHPGHDPVERYRILKKSFGTAGIDITYTEDLGDLRREVLDRYDAVMLYANWKQNEPMDPSQEQALLGYVEDGGAFLPIHCASACFGGAEAFVKLVGGRFKSHDDGVFRTSITAPDHPVMKGYEGFETWDETYVHDRHGDDRTILQSRDDEPWTWVRQQGKGRVFYTAYGHDVRCWSQPSFHELLRRAVLWSVGEEVCSKLTALKLPELEFEAMMLPGYKERKAITRGQKPLAPNQSIKLANVPDGFELALFASEPDIVNPIHIAWDHRGRAYVLETVDYPNNLQAGNLGHDRIRICEDTDGDGKADKFTLFAEKLSIPTSAVCVNGGLICTNGTQMLFFKDTDGDDKADVRTVLFEGFGMGDTHAGPSNLRYAPDNWIYATAGYSGFNGTVGGERHKFSQGLFRFRPDGSKLEFLQSTTNNTWGLGFNSDFDLMGSAANANPSWFFTLPKAAYENAGLEAPCTPRADNNPLFFPSSMDIRQVDVHGGYTSAAGHAFYTSKRFPESWRERIALVTEPTGKLVGRFAISREGSGYKAKHLPNNLFDSGDAWTSPVFAETGPDGAVWICDWYNIIIQHNPTPKITSAGMNAETGRGNAYETPLRDTSYGRIYRVYPKGTGNDRNPELDPADPGTLVAGLSHGNLFWRMESQRLLMESKAISTVEQLEEMVRQGGAGALHAFGALDGLGALDSETAALALKSSERGLRRLAIAHPMAASSLVGAFTHDGVIVAADPRELTEVLAALAKVAPSDAIGALLHATLVKNQVAMFKDRTLGDAWQIAARHHAAGVLLAAAGTDVNAPQDPPNLLTNPGFEEAGSVGWSLRSYAVSDPSKLLMQVVPRGRSGNCLMIRADAKADAGAGMDIMVKPHTRYRFGGWVRTENLVLAGGKGAMLNISEKQPTTQAISGTKDWTELSAEFNSGAVGSVLIHCLFGAYGGSTGTAYWDDVYLEEVGSGGISSLLLPVAGHVSFTGSAAEIKALTDELTKNDDDFSRSILATLAGKAMESKPVNRQHKPDPAVHERGLAVYNKTCIACHGPEGKGVPVAFPPLDGAPIAVGEPSVPIRIISHGLQGPVEVAGQKYNVPMAALAELKDAEVADVMTYVRQTWSNDAPPVSEETVKQVRAKYADRKTPWTIEELNPKSEVR
jgi:putative membrane-bound dehydrogenase-like protein